MAKKNFENVIGKIIYGTLLFMPLVSILARTMYVVCNKNAYISYSDKEQTETIANWNELEYDREYTLVNALGDTFTGNVMIIADYFYYKDQNQIETQLEGYTKMQLTGNNGVVFYGDNVTTKWKDTTNVSEVKFKYKNIQITTALTNFEGEFHTYTYTTAKNLDNVFEYSIEKVEQSPYYNWTTTTAIYSVVHNTTTTLQINNSFVDLLLTYWMLMTVIYVIYDIALIMLQLAHKKVHEIIEK